jgi:acetolactate synthase-1/2/3 large subunit
VVDEAASSGRNFVPRMKTGRPVDWLNVRGGSIGFGLPAAAGAAIACPDRKVVCLESDGSGMYTPQALWTMARENLDVTILLMANRSYATLVGEMPNVGIETLGAKARSVLELERPVIDWLGLARTLGVGGARVEDMDGFNREFLRGLATPGPYLIEIVLPGVPIP